MPFKSQAQRAWAAEQVKKGEWTQAQFDEWNKVTPADLPERVPSKGFKNSPTVKKVKVK